MLHTLLCKSCTIKHQVPQIVATAKLLDVQARSDEVTVVTNVPFRKSSYCEGGACVEVSVGSEAIFVRNSQRPEDATVAFSPQEWTAFVKGVRAGEFTS